MADKLSVIQSEETIKELKIIEEEVGRLIGDFNELYNTTTKLSSGFGSGKPKDFAKSLESVESVVLRINMVNKEVIKLEERIAKVSMDSAKARALNAKTLQEETKVTLLAQKAKTEEQRTINQTILAKQRQNKQINKDIGAYKEFSKYVNDAKLKAKNIGSEMIVLEKRFKDGEISTRQYNQQLNKLSKEYVEARTRALGLDYQIKKLDSSVGDHQRNVGNYNKNLNKLTTSFRSLLGAFGVVNAIDIFADIVRGSFETVKSLDALNYTLKQVFETDQQVALQKDYLREISQRYGLEIISTTEAFSKYSAAVKGTYLEGEKARKIFSSFSGASAKLGLNAEQTTGIFRALEQMISKGKIQAEELRGQLGDRMAGAFRLFADGLGVSTSELDKLLKDGKVIADDVLPNVAKRLDEVYSLNNSDKIDTLAGAQNRLKNEWTEFLDRIASDKELVSGLADVMAFLGEVLGVTLDTLIIKGEDGHSVLGDLIDIINTFLGAINELTGSTQKQITVVDQYRADLMQMKSVVMVVAGAITYLTETFVNLFNVSLGWDEWVSRMEKAADKFLNTIGQYNKMQEEAKYIKNPNKSESEIWMYNEEQKTKKYKKAWDDAKKSKWAYFAYNDKWFDAKTGRNTGKSIMDYDENLNPIKQNQRTKLLEDQSKTKKHGGSKLTGEQRDNLMLLNAVRDKELAINERKYVEGKINEKQYLEEILRINTGFFDSKISYLKGNNAKELAELAKTELEKSKLIKETQKKRYDIDSKQLEENYKIQSNLQERQHKELENNDYLTNVDRLSKQIQLDNEMIDQANEYYSKQIDLAKNAAQSTLEWERKRDEEVGKLQDAQLKKVRSQADALQKDLEAQINYNKAFKDLTYEQQKSAILTNRKLSDEERSYQLSILEKNNQIEQNNLEIKRLESIQEQLKAKVLLAQINGLVNQDDVNSLTELEAQIQKLKNANTELNKDIINEIAPKWKALGSIISSGLRDLGLDNVAAQFDAMFDKIINKTADWKDYTKLAAEAVNDLSSQLITSQKEKRIAALDEELKKSQENTELEVGFINQRLEYLNNLETLTAEQYTERARLQDEARTLEEQQQQREKLIAEQKARAEQRASAQQALINGLLAATTTLANLGVPAGIIPAAVAAGIGVTNAALIMSKNPVPEYWVGRNNGPSEFAWTQERGREIITDENDNIKSLGSDGGRKMTWLDKGDKVYTASQTKDILKRVGNINIGDNVFRSAALKSIQAPVIIHKQEDNSMKIAQEVSKQMERVIKKYSNPRIAKKNGKIIEYNGGNTPVVIGTYDLKTKEEEYYAD